MNYKLLDNYGLSTILQLWTIIYFTASNELSASLQLAMNYHLFSYL